MIEFPDLTPARLGLVHRFGQPPILCYDLAKVLARYEADGMTPEEAMEFFNFNVIGAWVGETTPCFLETEVDWDALPEADDA